MLQTNFRSRLYFLSLTNYFQESKTRGLLVSRCYFRPICKKKKKKYEGIEGTKTEKNSSTIPPPHEAGKVTVSQVIIGAKAEEQRLLKIRMCGGQP